jgi:predicted amidohydrolase
MRVASIQVAIDERPQADRLRHVLALLARAAGCNLILLPELWPCGAFAFDRFATSAETVGGPLVSALRDRACGLGAYLLLGSFVERAGDELFNTSLLLDPKGEVSARYRKMHLFGYQSQERQLLSPGTEVVTARTPWGKAGLSICYDLRFPELYRRLIDETAAFFLVPAAWPRPRLEAWRLFNRSRAHENLACLFSCNCAGRQGAVSYGGHSMLVDPYGNVLAEAGEEEEIITAEIDAALVERARGEFPALDDRVLRTQDQRCSGNQPE